MRNYKFQTVLIVGFTVAMTSGVCFAGFIRIKKPGAKTPAPTAANPVSSPSSPALTAPQGPLIRGTYKFMCIGTEGADAQDVGNDGIISVSASGDVSGTLYYYDDGSTGILSGNLNPSNGEGTAILRNSKRGWVANYTFTGKITTKQFFVIQGDYRQKDSTSKGIFWCIQEVP